MAARALELRGILLGRGFGRPEQGLDVAQSAVLAAIIQAPNALSPDKNLEGLTRRWNYVLDGMVTMGKLSAADRAAITFPSGWALKPDVEITMPKAYNLPAKGTINYKFILVKGNINEDMWIEAAEMRPGNNKVVHHGKVWVRPPGSHWMEKAVPGEAYEQETQLDIMGKNNPAEAWASFPFKASEMRLSSMALPSGSCIVNCPSVPS